MACQSRPDRDRRRFKVPYFSHHDDIRILPQNGPEGRRERHIRGLVHAHLRYSRDAVFDGVFDREDTFRLRSQLLQEAVERGRLSTPGWTGNKYHPLWLACKLNEWMEDVLWDTEFTERDQAGRVVQQTDDDV